MGDDSGMCERQHVAGAAAWRRSEDVGVTADRAQLAVALELATTAHRGQVYPSPEREPYICHPIRVMEALEEGDEQIVALLHDVLEDTSVDVAELRELGFDEHIVRAILLLTHDRTVPYADYIERLAHDPLARRVKLADLADNLRNNRRLESTSGVCARISRYEAAQHFLEAWSRGLNAGGTQRSRGRTLIKHDRTFR